MLHSGIVDGLEKVWKSIRNADSRSRKTMEFEKMGQSLEKVWILLRPVITVHKHDRFQVIDGFQFLPVILGDNKIPMKWSGKWPRVAWKMYGIC